MPELSIAMSLNFRCNHDDCSVGKLSQSVRTDVKLLLSLPSLRSHEAPGVGVAPTYSSVDGRPYSFRLVSPSGHHALKPMFGSAPQHPHAYFIDCTE